jgi:DNA repair photolyase
MVSPQKIVISASRRTDIPAFYMSWFMEQLNLGRFYVENPFNRRIKRVPATPHEVDTFVFWSKNFGPFLVNGYGEKLRSLGYHLFFNFSINSEDHLLEPKVPSLAKRLDQLACLSRKFGPKSITWRFDPICFYRVNHGRVNNNLKDFLMIAKTAADCGITRCVTSFLDQYKKVRQRAKKRHNITFEDISIKDKVYLIEMLATQLNPLNIALKTCCEKEVVEAVGNKKELTSTSCIPNDLLMDLFGGHLSLRADRGQRVKAGCGCKVSMDIGSYRLHPCHHDCLFCYANPVCDDKYRDKNDQIAYDT